MALLKKIYSKAVTKTKERYLEAYQNECSFRVSCIRTCHSKLSRKGKFTNFDNFDFDDVILRLAKYKTSLN